MRAHRSLLLLIFCVHCTGGNVSTPDAATDTGRDVSFDSTHDTAADVSDDTALDTGSDAAYDEGLDVAPEVAADTGPTCPPPPADLLDAMLVGPGNPLIQRQLSGQIVAIPVPDVSPHGSGQIALGETPAASSPQPVTIEVSINRCRGVIDTDLTNYCNLRSTNGNYNSITWLSQPYMTITDRASANLRGYCWAPASEGPWYVNARWTYSQCGFGSSTCGYAIQYNYGPY